MATKAKTTKTTKTTKSVPAPNLAVKGVKSFRGMEGLGFNATLLLNGQPAALVIDQGNGGQYLFRWSDRAAEKTIMAYATAVAADFPAEKRGYGLPKERFSSRILRTADSKAQVISELLNSASGGHRVVCDGKVAFAGLGNRSGPWGAGSMKAMAKWDKSGKKLEARLEKLFAEGKPHVVEIHRFHSINRDRGRWTPTYRATYTPGKPVKVWKVSY